MRAFALACLCLALAGAAAADDTMQGACAIADGTVVRCTAGENNVTIFLVEDGAKRHFPNADVYASYLRPRVGLDETGDCPEISACPDGEPMPYQEPEGECEIPPGTVVFCNSTGEMSVVDTEGRRRWFNSAAVWASYLHPPVQFEEGGDCPLIAACRAGERLQLKEPTGVCDLPDGTITLCSTTGEISMVMNGTRHWFGPGEDVYQSYGAPQVDLEEAGDCARIAACPAGENVDAEE